MAGFLSIRFVVCTVQVTMSYSWYMVNLVRWCLLMDDIIIIHVPESISNIPVRAMMCLIWNAQT